MSDIVVNKKTESMIETQIVMKIPARNAIVCPIQIGMNLLATPEKWLPDDWQKKRIVIITDETVHKIYGKYLLEVLKEAKPLLFSFIPGEQSKNAQTKLAIEEKMLEAGCDRQTLLLTLGGGVVGDLAGYIAATYMRGISYIQIPTTLLAMVDSSVGGKTGINVPQGKNLIGAFWQPVCVVVNIDCLKSLPEIHLINGLVEAIKMFCTNDAEYFKYVDKELNRVLQKETTVLKNIIERAIQIKVNVVSHDETESNLRMILNFGHTIGHALEQVTHYSILHGYAVAIGILVEAKISHLSGFLSVEDYNAIESLFYKLKISLNPLKTMDCDAIIQATKVDKKIRNNQVRFVLLQRIGKVYHENDIIAHPVSDEIIIKALKEVGGMQDGRQ